MGKRILSLILCLTMIFSLFPTAFADEDTTAEVPAETVEETTAQQNGGNEYPLDETAEPAEPASEQPETDSNEAEPASETEPQAESETQTPVEQSAAESGETAGVGQPAEEDEELPPAGEITAAEAEPVGQIESGEEETAEGAGEENAENEPAAGSDEPERYAVAFQCDPEGTVVTVYDTKDLNENAEPRRIEPGTDGTYLLLPGEYCYDAACEGYESIEKCSFTVDDRPLTISLQLTEAAPKRGVGLRTTQENTVVSHGYCGADYVNEGKDVLWTLYSDGMLEISGSGEMANFYARPLPQDNKMHTTAPWGAPRYLRSVSVSSGVTSIGNNAFYGCSGLTSLTLPEGVTSIGACAFYGCSGLTSLVIPEGVTSIGESAFYGCSGLTSLTLPEGVTDIGESAFSRCSGLTSLVIPEGVTVISAGTFSGCLNLTSLTLPESVTVIGADAFYQCRFLTSLVIPEGVTSIGAGAFSDCSVTSLVIPEGVTVISDCTFSDCLNLTSLTLPDGVTGIGEEAFYNCSHLTSLTLPASLTAIGNNAFYGCSGLKDVYYAGSKLSWQNVYAGALPSGTTVHFAKPSCFYDANGGEGAPPAQDGEPGTVVKIPSVIPERERCDFAGWATTPTAESPEYQPGDSVVLDGEITLYAVWTIWRYTITYYANGGSGAPAAQSEYYGTDSTISYTVPTRTGYTFLGWNRDPYSLDPEYRGGDAYTAQEPIILYAVWARVVYTLSYNANGGDGVPEDQIVAAGRYHTVSDVEPSRYYYTFRGWALSPDAGTAQYQAGDQIQAQKAITLYAVWEPNDCFVIYYANGGSGAPEYQVVPYDSMMMISDVVPTREGYDFVGWAFSGTAETASYKPGDVMHITGDSNLYAVWKGVDCTISYDANGGTGAPEPQQAVYGGTAFLSDVIPERQHYDFEGWAKTPDASSPEYEVGGDYYVEGSATLYAVWSPSSSIRCSGTCGAQGDNLRWTLFYDGWLIISGQGNMQDYRQRVDDTVTPDAPWNDYASGIRYLLIEEGVTSIGNCAFFICSSLQSAKLPSTLNRIGDGAFFKLENLTSVNIPAALTDLGNMPFADCSALTTAGGPGSGCNVILEGTVIPVELFNRCTGLTSVDIPEGVVEIESRAFRNCENLSHVVIPSTVEEMFHAFSDCSNLTSIGPRGSGSSIELGDVARIPMNAFADMPGLRTVTLPASVIEIALFAFDNCSSLTRIMFYGETPEIDTLAFSGVNAYAYYPSGKNWQEKDRQNYGGQLTWVSYEVYTVSYDANGGTGAPAKQTKIGSETIQISGVTPVREGFNFLGWAESPTATTASYIAGDRYYAKRDLNLYAVWQVIMHATPVLKSISHEPGGVKLTWSAVDGADKYRVFRRAGGSGSWITLADTTDTYFVDASAQSGVSYSYTVRCVTPDGKVYASDYDTVGLSITFVSTPVIQTIESTSEGIHLTWTKPQGSVRFRIFRKIADSGWLMLEDTNAVSFVDRSVTEGTRYTYSIRCITSDGSSYSSAFDAAGKTITHTKVYATPVIRSLLSMPEGIQLTWSESVGAEKYRVFRKTATTGWTKIRDVSSTSYLDTAVTDGTTYVYTVRCITSDGSAYTSAFDSAGKSVTYSKDLPTPIISSLASTPDGVKLTWNAIAGAAKYRVFRKTSSTGWTKLTDTANPNYVDGTAANGTTYTYTVRCVSADGSTFTSGFDSTGKTITFTTIDTPIISSITGTGDGVKLVWNVPSGAVKYRVFRKTGTTGWTKLADTANASYIDGKAVNGETYTYTVRCINAAGTAYTSGFDSTGKTITFSIVATPEIAIIRNTGDGVQLVWYKCTGAEKYRVFRKTANGGWTKVADTVNTSFIDAKAVSGVTYTYTVRCTNSAGTVYTSGFDSTGKTITCKIIDTPHIQTIENLSGGIKLTWNAPTGAEKYFVFRKTNGGGWQKVAETVNTTFTDAKVSSNTTYTYTVRCVSADGSVYTSKYDTVGMTITRN